MQYAHGGSEVRSSFMPLVGGTPWLIRRQYSPSTFYSAAGAGDARWRVGCLRRLADVDVCLRLVAHLHSTSSMRTFRRHHVLVVYHIPHLFSRLMPSHFSPLVPQGSLNACSPVSFLKNLPISRRMFTELTLPQSSAHRYSSAYSYASKHVLTTAWRHQHASVQ